MICSFHDVEWHGIGNGMPLFEIGGGIGMAVLFVTITIGTSMFLAAGRRTEFSYRFFTGVSFVLFFCCWFRFGCGQFQGRLHRLVFFSIRENVFAKHDEGRNLGV